MRLCLPSLPPLCFCCMLMLCPCLLACSCVPAEGGEMLEPSSFLSRVPHLPPHPAAWENGDDAQRGCPQEDGITVSGPKMRNDA